MHFFPIWQILSKQLGPKFNISYFWAYSKHFVGYLCPWYMMNNESYPSFSYRKLVKLKIFHEQWEKNDNLLIVLINKGMLPRFHPYCFCQLGVNIFAIECREVFHYTCFLWVIWFDASDVWWLFTHQDCHQIV